MKRSNRLVILVGVLLAVLAFVGIVVVLNQGGGPGTAGEGEPQMVNVTVATEAIDIGTPVTADNTETREVNADAVVQTRIPDNSILTGRPALVPINEGQQITQEMVTGVGGPGPEDQLLAGEKAIAFQVDRVTGLDFLIQPGDHIDIVVTQQVQVLQPTIESLDDPDAPQRFETIPGLENARTVKTILQDRRVLYVSQTRIRQQQPEASPTPGQQQGEQPQQLADSVIIVFAGSAQDAEVIKFAQNDLSEVGSLTAILRRTEDTEEEVPDEETTGVTIDILFEQYGIPIPDIIVDLGPEEGP